ncbi:MAG: hypothetical protein GY787_16250 [Alteromonadales bacterium]|nr:hypothetical protein [Alteromonadales bacterium]
MPFGSSDRAHEEGHCFDLSLQVDNLFEETVRLKKENDELTKSVKLLRDTLDKAYFEVHELRDKNEETNRVYSCKNVDGSVVA